MDEKDVARVQEAIFELLTLWSRHVAGDYTLNQIRVLQYIHMCWRYRETPTTHAEICMALDLPSATVSRAVSRFLGEGSLREEVDPADGRRRLIGGTGLTQGAEGDLDLAISEIVKGTRLDA
jgi:DNA-binding MarR family transcriptional regulator